MTPNKTPIQSAASEAAVKAAIMTPPSHVADTQSMSDPDKSDYDDMKGGVDYDDYDFEDEYLPRGRQASTPGRPSRRGRGRGRPTAGPPTPGMFLMIYIL